MQVNPETTTLQTSSSTSLRLIGPEKPRGTVIDENWVPSGVVVTVVFWVPVAKPDAWSGPLGAWTVVDVAAELSSDRPRRT